MAISLRSKIDALRVIIRREKEKGRDIGFVPTMGYLHRGHQSLIEASSRDGFFTVVSVFVNPAQFGPGEDLESYPRDEERDYELSVAAGADLVWYPAVEDLYPAGAQTRVEPGVLAQRLCGISRPRFFGGICTVVLKFLNLIEPDRAYFGEKDFQQLAIIRRMVADLCLRTEIIGCATVREADGLAMSSRNARLPATDRETALALYRAIKGAQQAFAKGERLVARVKPSLIEHWPAELELDYLEFRDPTNLDPVEELASQTRLFIGAWLNGVRLIDNAAMRP